MISLIDSDIVAYRSAASAELEEEWVALARLDELMHRILDNTNASSYKAFLTGDSNFRREIFPEYKANRTQPKPTHLLACKSYLIEHWQAEVFEGAEADDALGIAATANPDETIICSIDKDLRQIPGNHFNFIKLEMDYVDEYAGWYNFYAQFLIGDTSDNIKGVHGIGPKKTEKILYGLTPEEMFAKVRELYADDKRMLLNGQLLWLWRYNNNIWTHPDLISASQSPQEEVAESKSMKPEMDSSSGPTMPETTAGFPVDGE